MKLFNSKNKSSLYNILMISLIISGIIIAAFTVGSLKGWFNKEKPVTVVNPDGSVKSVDITVFNKSGNVNIERSGVSFNLDEGTKLRSNDLINTLSGSEVSIKFGQNKIIVNEKTKCKIKTDKKGKLTFELKEGEIFSNIQTDITFIIFEKCVNVSNAVLSLSCPYGSATINVFKNSIIIENKTVDSGKSASVLKDKINIGNLSVESLNQFNLKNILEETKSASLCFTYQQIINVKNLRKEASRDALQAKLLTENVPQKIENKKDNGTSSKEIKSDKNPELSSSDESKTDSASSKKEEGNNSESGEQSSAGQDNPKQEILSCTITIVCNTILDNIGDLEEGKEPYVPPDGVILEISKVNFTKGETVFDVLKKVCSIAGIQLEYSWTPMYNSYYIEGINNIYEFDCGFESGWMYKVNEWFPNYGCSSYNLKDKDNIVWCYTCKGLGADVGGNVY